MLLVIKFLQKLHLQKGNIFSRLFSNQNNDYNKVETAVKRKFQALLQN